MKRGISILVVLLTLGALLGATPAAATTTISLCDRLSWSETVPPYRSHLFVGTHTFGTHTVEYYLHTEGVGSRGYFSSADRTICPYDPIIINPGPVTITATERYGQDQCTAPGTFAAIVNGKIASYDFVGQTSTYYRNYPVPSTFRFWHIMLQTAPGVWTWWDSVVAIC